MILSLFHKIPSQVGNGVSLIRFLTVISSSTGDMLILILYHEIPNQVGNDGKLYEIPSQPIAKSQKPKLRSSKK